MELGNYNLGLRKFEVFGTISYYDLSELRGIFFIRIIRFRVFPIRSDPFESIVTRGRVKAFPTDV